MTAEDVRDRWMSKLTAEPDAACGRGAASEHLVRHLLAKTTIPILQPDPGRTWIWSDLTSATARSSKPRADRYGTSRT